VASYTEHAQKQSSNFLIIYLLAYENETDSVPKRQYIKFRRREISQKKIYNSFKTFCTPLSGNVKRALSISERALLIGERALSIGKRALSISDNYYFHTLTNLRIAEFFVAPDDVRHMYCG
jgi:hypothetical protein